MYGLQAALHGGHGVAHQAERHVTIVTGRTTSSLCAGIAYKKLQDFFPVLKPVEQTKITRGAGSYRLFKTDFLLGI